jgi:pantothenate kinase type III
VQINLLHDVISMPMQQIQHLAQRANLNLPGSCRVLASGGLRNSGRAGEGTKGCGEGHLS